MQITIIPNIILGPRLIVELDWLVLLFRPIRFHFYHIVFFFPLTTWFHWFYQISYGNICISMSWVWIHWARQCLMNCVYCNLWYPFVDLLIRQNRLPPLLSALRLSKIFCVHLLLSLLEKRKLNPQFLIVSDFHIYMVPRCFLSFHSYLCFLVHFLECPYFICSRLAISKVADCAEYNILYWSDHGVVVRHSLLVVFNWETSLVKKYAFSSLLHLILFAVLIRTVKLDRFA